MRTVIGVLLILLVSWVAPASAIDPFEVNPLVWLHESAPTARSFGMAFTDVTSIHRTPSPTGPGSVGLWALHDNVYFSHVWDNQSDLYRDLVRYQVSNTMYAVGATAADLGIDSPFPAAMGILRRRGESNTTYYPEERHRWNRPRDVSDWVVALGADIGVQIGLGLRLSYRNDPPEEFEPAPIARDWYAAYSIRLSLQHLMDQLNLDPRPLDFGTWEVDPIVSYASDHLSESEQTGYAYGLTMTMKSLPVLSAEHIINPKADNESSGWELCLWGTYAYRRGERPWPMTEIIWFEEAVPVPDWSTEGHAIYSSGLQQWMHHWIDPSESSVLGWILQNVHVRYEWAAFRHPEERPEETLWYLNQLGVREGSIEITGLRELWDNISR